MPRFFAIEGLSASGKSAAFDLLKDGPAFVGVPSIPREFQKTRNAFTEQDQADSRFLFFASALSFTSTLIRRHLFEGRNVVVESFIYRTISFHRGFGATVEVQWPESMPIPDRMFFLQCDEGVRQKRIRDRGRPHNLWDALAEKNRERILDEYARWKSTVIDTTSMPPEEVAAQILGEV